jgi:hypothetical protein
MGMRAARPRRPITTLQAYKTNHDLLSLDAALGLRISNLSGHLYRMSCTTTSCTCTKDQACALDFIVIHPNDVVSGT